MTWRAKLAEGLATLDAPEPVAAPVEAAGLPAPRARARRSPVIAAPKGVLEDGDLAGQLERATIRAIERSEDLLELEIDNDAHEKFGDKLRALNAIIKTIVGTQVRVDEHRLKARKLDVLPELLARIAEAEKTRKLIEA